MNCKQDVREPGPWPHYSPCKRKATTEAGYCKQHDPATVKARREKSNAEWLVKYEEERSIRRVKEAGPDLLKAAKEVIGLLEKHGGSIVPHLMDTDENAGQRLRDAIAKAEGK